MSVEKSNTKITINGNMNISDYERKLRSTGFASKLYRTDLLNYIESKNLDPIVKNKILAETANIPCQAIHHMFPRMDDMIRKIQKQVNEERSTISEMIVIPEKTTNSLDIGDLYSSINDNISQIDEPNPAENQNETVENDETIPAENQNETVENDETIPEN
jgi:hypothetical protein